MESLKSDIAVNRTDNLQNVYTKAVNGPGSYGYKISTCHETEKKLPFSDIVVVCNDTGHDYRAFSDFGDVAYAVRAVRVLSQEFQDRSLKLIVEGEYNKYRKKNNDYEIFKRITSIPDVETILVNNHACSSNKSETNQKVKEYLHNAEVIVHGPVNTISVFRDHSRDFSGKTIYFDQYNCSSIWDIEKNYPGIEYLGTGFPGLISGLARESRTGGMFLKEPDINQSQFEDIFLRDQIKLTDKTFLYFCNQDKAISLKSSIILFSNLECPFGQDITIVSRSSEMKAQLLDKEIDDIWDKSYNRDNPVKKFRLISSMGMEKDWDDPETGIGRTVTILISNSFSPNDAFLLGKHAKCTVVGNDISMSDVFAAGRIPVADTDGKYDNAAELYKHLQSFSEQHPQYQQQVECMRRLMGAMSSIDRETSAEALIHKFKIVGTQEWTEFEQSYINYLRSQPGAFLEDNLCNAVRRKLETQSGIGNGCSLQ